MSPIELERLRAIRLVALDIDGVLSDGVVSVDEEGNQRRNFDIKDGLGVVRLVESGRRVIVISSSSSTAGVERLRQLGIDPVLTGVKDKLQALGAEVTADNLEWSGVAYMGDDLPDIPCLQAAGLSVAPADAVAPIREIVDIVMTRPGGRGAVRELSDLLISADEADLGKS